MSTNKTIAIPAAHPTGPTPPAHAALNVLLVDDDSFQLELMSEVMASLGVRSTTPATSGAQALQLLSEEHLFDLLLLDLHMPDMDGFKFMNGLAQTTYAGALIIVSGQSGDVMDAATMMAKLHRFTLLGTLSKPVGREALSRLIAKLG